MGRKSDVERYATVVTELDRLAAETPPQLLEEMVERPVTVDELDRMQRGSLGCVAIGVLTAIFSVVCVAVVGMAATEGIEGKGVATGLLIALGALALCAFFGMLGTYPIRLARRLGAELVDGLDHPVVASPMLCGVWVSGPRDARIRYHQVTFAADQEGTTFLTVTVLFGSFRAKAWSYKPWWMVGADRGWIVGELKAGAPVALIDRYGGITVGQATRIKI